MTRYLSSILLFVSIVATSWAQERKSTALPNVEVFRQEFKIPGLDRWRKLRVYIPSNYNSGEKWYPVLYMHDAQNLFDDSTSYVGEWGVDESMVELSKSGLDLIVVGIDNGGDRRVNEMTPWKNEKFGDPEGEEYIKFIVDVVKPFIDAKYRTRRDPANTGIMGSSLGGLISHYAVYSYPETFGKAGIFSPSYWFAEEVFDFTRANPIPRDHKLYLYAGGKEGESMVPELERMYNLILAEKHPNINITSKVNPEGEHSEKYWRSEFSEAIKWLFR